MKITVKITAAITAGGRSSRFGSDKALFKLGEKTLLEWVASSFEPSGFTHSRRFDHRMIIAPLGRYRLAGWETLPEKHPGRGPLGGLEVALEHSKSDWTAFAAVDLPFLTPVFWEILVGEISLNQHMLESLEGKNQAGIYTGIQALVPLDSQNQVQPLCALYHRSSLPFVHAQLHRQNYTLKALLERMTVHYVAWEKLEKVSLPNHLPNHIPDHLKGNLFFNLNSPKDLQTIRGRLNSDTVI